MKTVTMQTVSATLTYLMGSLVETLGCVTALDALVLVLVLGHEGNTASQGQDSVPEDSDQVSCIGTMKILAMLTREAVWFPMEATAGTLGFATVAAMMVLAAVPCNFPPPTPSFSTSLDLEVVKG